MSKKLISKKKVFFTYIVHKQASTIPRFGALSVVPRQGPREKMIVFFLFGIDFQHTN